MKTKIAILVVCVCATLTAAEFKSSWPANANRPWAGGDYWANPMQDWRLKDGRLECFVAGGDRNVFLLTHELTAARAPFSTSVKFGRLESDQPPLKEGFAGFRIGIRGSFNDYRDSAVRGDGLEAGLTAEGRLFIGLVPIDGATFTGRPYDMTLRLDAAPASGDNYALTLSLIDASGKTVLSTRREDIPSKWLVGGLALVCHSGQIRPSPPDPELLEGFAERRGTARGGTLRFWFRDWTVSGEKVAAHPQRAFGPILFAMHTLSRGVLKLTAQLAPVDDGPREVELQTRASAKSPWKTISTVVTDPMARTATFRISNWNDRVATPYRVIYRMEGKEHSFEGTIRRDPVNKAKITVAAFTGNNDLGFPHADIVRNVSHFKPDLLFYSGDNIYERVGEFGIQRAPLETATLDYLRKWYLFGWEYSELLKDIPAFAIPDDHDVYHGNLWGAGGKRSWGEGYEGQDRGGYVMPAEWVNMVQRTQTSHHPDAYDSTPVDQGISVYYGPALYGGISFAVLEDRKWKSAPKTTIPKAQIINGWAQNPAYNAAVDGDAPGAELLGARQEKFLEEWAKDWSGGAWMKVVLSQTIFANVATLPKGSVSDAITPKLVVVPQGGYAEKEAPVADHDSNAWPQTPRMRALRSMRRALAFHIAGDQHLGSTIQYGIDGWDDGGWALCVPSVANVWPRRWFPETPGLNRKPGAPAYTGQFTEGFGNKITVHAVSNPHEVDMEPKALYRRAPGYGIVVFDKATRDISIANWPRWVDATKAGAKPYPGWPVRINQLDNGYPKNGPELRARPAAGTVIQVVNRDTGEIAYTLRVPSGGFVPRAPKPGNWEVKVIK
jgi:phosphodiesterase/alkaline phosphatase D-like protein